MTRTAPFVLAFAASIAAQSPAPAPAPVPAPVTAPIVAVGAADAATPAASPRPIDLAICLDISGSMDGLIDAARQNLWHVVNDLATLQPTPTLRVALLTFGCSAHDAEKGWVKVETDFTTDLDIVSQKLFALTTNGGEEYVARVMQAALTELTWSPDQGALQLLFVAGNEAATQDPKLDVPSQSKLAISRGIVVNSIYCGDPMDGIAPGWRDVAKLADGQFAAIQQDQSMAIPTPFDKQLQELSAALNPTYVPYGAARQAWAENQVAQDNNASVLNPAAAAARCQTKASAFYCNPANDLVDATADPKFKLEDVKKDDLPEALRSLSIAELRAHVEQKRTERNALKQQIEAAGKQRDAFLQDELKKLGQEGDKRFEKAVLESVRSQAAARGFTRKQEEAKPAQPAPRGGEAKEGKVVLDERFTETLRAAVVGYEKFARVTGEPRVAPTDCRMHAPNVRRSTADKAHGGKLYLLYARHAEGDQYVKPGQAAAVGQTLVKEAWQCVERPVTGPNTAAARHHIAPRIVASDKTWYAGEAVGLFVMHKLAADTPGTDQGWIYGTLAPDGQVTSAGAVSSCIACHRDAPEDRRYGLR